jgi:hypothetical protein
VTKICGRRPLHGDGSVWCVLKERHVGAHRTGMNTTFIRLQPGDRVDCAYYPALDPSTSTVEKRKASRRLAPQVGKAGALPEQGRRVGRDRRSGRVISTVKGNRAAEATLDMLRAATNRLQWYVRRHGRRESDRWKPPQSAVDGVTLASTLAAFVAGDPGQAPIEGLLLLRDVLERIPRHIELVKPRKGARCPLCDGTGKHHNFGDRNRLEICSRCGGGHVGK